MLAGIRDVLIISTPHDQPLFYEMLNDGSQWGMNLQYAVQPKPEGLAQAFIIGRKFIGEGSVCLTLGDNIFYGHGFQSILEKAASRNSGATVFGYWVKDPERYGVAEFDKFGLVIDLAEKPERPKSHYAVTGLYFYDNQVGEMAATLQPSARGELEITDLNKIYLQRKQLRVERLGRGIAWLDTGTHTSLMQASNFIQTIEERQGLKVCCPEEIAYFQGWISCEDVEKLGLVLAKTDYGQYLLNMLKEGRFED